MLIALEDRFFHVLSNFHLHAPRSSSGTTNQVETLIPQKLPSFFQPKQDPAAERTEDQHPAESKRSLCVQCSASIVDDCCVYFFLELQTGITSASKFLAFLGKFVSLVLRELRLQAVDNSNGSISPKSPNKSYLDIRTWLIHQAKICMISHPKYRDIESRSHSLAPTTSFQRGKICKSQTSLPWFNTVLFKEKGSGAFRHKKRIRIFVSKSKYSNHPVGQKHLLLTFCGRNLGGDSPSQEAGHGWHRLWSAGCF